MADSVDRVFVHALNTVKKMPQPGRAKPPIEDRLNLYGLYKQSMEGDVTGVMPRPEGPDEEAERNKWDSWFSRRDMSKTEAKRQYITTLIDAMHRYATITPEAKELVAELEFVWDQIKSNVPSSSSSPHESQLQPLAEIKPDPSPFQHDDDSIDGEDEYHTMDELDEHGLPRMLVLRTGNHKQDEIGQESILLDEDSPIEERTPIRRNRVQSLQRQDSAVASSDAGRRSNSGAHNRKPSKAPSNHEPMWKKRVEQALTKMTAEVAALREQLEIRRSTAAAAGTKLALVQRWITWAAWIALKHFVVDAVLLMLVLAWMKRKGDKRAVLAIKLMTGFLSDKLFWWRGRKRATGRFLGIVGTSERAKAMTASSEIVAFT